MLVVLVLSVISAMSLVQLRGAPARRGVQLLEQLRQKKISAYWPMGLQQRWYLGQIRGQAVACVGHFIIGTDEGFFGLELLMDPAGEIATGSWQIDPSASKGTYTGRVRTPRGTIIQQVTIELDNRMVRVTARHLNRQAVAPVPENYVPEGMLDLLAGLACSDGENALVQIIYDNQALTPRGAVVFQPISFKPVDARSVQLGSSPGARVYHFDADGKLVKMTSADDGLEYNLANINEIVDQLPQAEKLLQLPEVVGFIILARQLLQTQDIPFETPDDHQPDQPDQPDKLLPSDRLEVFLPKLEGFADQFVVVGGGDRFQLEMQIPPVVVSPRGHCA